MIIGDAKGVRTNGVAALPTFSERRGRCASVRWRLGAPLADKTAGLTLGASLGDKEKDSSLGVPPVNNVSGLPLGVSLGDKEKDSSLGVPPVDNVPGLPLGVSLAEKETYFPLGALLADNM